MTHSKNKHLVVILGPTASGKTKVAVELAQKLDCPVLSCDSRQFYREMKIGTAKPDISELNEVPHHFLGHISVTDEYNVHDFEKDALNKLEEIYQDKDYAILCGGSGLFANAVCFGFDKNIPPADEKIREQLNQKLKREGIDTLQQQLKNLDPSFYNEVDLNNPYRLIRAIEVCLQTGKKYSELRKGQKVERPFKIHRFGLLWERDTLNNRINTRVDQMMEEGLLEEVKDLMKHKKLNALNSVGYKELFKYIEEDGDLNNTIEKIKQNTRKFAKRQMTWFKRDDDIVWVSPERTSSLIEHILSHIDV